VAVVLGVLHVGMDGLGHLRVHSGARARSVKTPQHPRRRTLTRRRSSADSPKVTHIDCRGDDGAARLGRLLLLRAHGDQLHEVEVKRGFLKNKKNRTFFRKPKSDQLSDHVHWAVIETLAVDLTHDSGRSSKSAAQGRARRVKQQQQRVAIGSEKPGTDSLCPAPRAGPRGAGVSGARIREQTPRDGPRGHLPHGHRQGHAPQGPTTGGQQESDFLSRRPWSVYSSPSSLCVRLAPTPFQLRPISTPLARAICHLPCSASSTCAHFPVLAFSLRGLILVRPSTLVSPGCPCPLLPLPSLRCMRLQRLHPLDRGDPNPNERGPIGARCARFKQGSRAAGLGISTRV
jgi:hypothetical protein